MRVALPVARTPMSLVLAMSSSLAGCAVYPLPQDVTGYDTTRIVASVRCQAQRAVQASLTTELARLRDRKVTRTLTGGELLARLEAPEGDPHRITFNELELKNFIGDAKKSFAYYSTTQIGYEFTLDMREQNLQGVNIDLLRQFLRRTDAIGIGVSTDRMRQNTRNFRVQDTFGKLALGISAGPCPSEPDPNIVYPMTGRMPVEDLVATYITVNQFASLGRRQGDKFEGFEGTKAGPAVREMADTIMFTTRLAARNNPTIDYNPGFPGFAVAGLGFTNENNRQDMHKVTVLLTTTEVGKTLVSKGGRLVEQTNLPPPDARRDSTTRGLDEQRARSFQDAIINLSNTGIRATLF